MKKKNRLEQVRAIVDEVIERQLDKNHARCGYVHLYGVATTCALLAIRRGLDPELASVAGMLHDIYTYRTNLPKLHAQNSAEDARVILRDLEIFTSEEQHAIRQAIFRHSDKELTHEPFDELLKDADVFQHYLYNTKLPLARNNIARLHRVFEELQLDKTIIENHPTKNKPAKTETVKNRRNLIADSAEKYAKQKIFGTEQSSSFQSIIKYFPGNPKDFIHNWCAAFAFHCCMEAHLVLPIKYPYAVSGRFAGVKAWLEWSQLPETNFYYACDDDKFTPCRGDIVIFDNLFNNGPHDHIGIVLANQNNILTTGEGNVNNQSAIMKRDRFNKVNGFIRICDQYEYV